MQASLRRPNAIPKASAVKALSPTQRLWRQAAWGCAAAAALIAAVAASRSEIGVQRIAPILSSWHAAQNQAPPHSFDAEAAARMLAQAVRDLREDRDRLAKRLTAVEHGMDDLTGSIEKQIEEAKAASSPAPAPTPWPLDAPAVPMTPADIAAMVKSVSPSNSAAAADAASPPAEPAPAAAPPPAYGADVASAGSMKTLHSRWAGLRNAHRQIFEGLQPVVSLRENARTNRIELHLLIGPFANADAAAQLCVALVKFRLPCEPTILDGSHLALQ